MKRLSHKYGTAAQRTRLQRKVQSAVVGIRGMVRFNAPLSEYTSFRIGGPADVLVEPADVEDVIDRKSVV